jgi:hypothetical protein
MFKYSAQGKAIWPGDLESLKHLMVDLIGDIG